VGSVDVLLQGETPLHIACSQGLANLAGSLLEAGANANVQTTSSDGDVMKQTPLHLAVESGHQDVVRVFLDFKGKHCHITSAS